MIRWREMEPRILYLTDEEWSLLADLLESEERTLSVQARPSTTHKFHDALQDKLKVLNGLLERLRQQAA